MSYFSDNYVHLAYPIPTAAEPKGLYNAQLGAIHALASHFTVDDQPAIVTMPTGSGKTAVLMMLPFLLRIERALVITPSRLVRGQIAEDYEALNTLRALRVLPQDIARPRVCELDERITSREEWEDLREFDVVISTPNCTSPGYEGIPAIPDDLFDFLIIDEAHHSPAHTWAALLNTFRSKRRALFSATPFRRDRGEIPGRFAFNYPIARAYADHIFGRIAYVQVDPAHNESNDIAIAKKTAEVFADDRRAGLNHFVMVRTDRKIRAKELAQIYLDNTPLRLSIVHSGLSNRTVRRVLGDLERGALDGIICVNMMGEGFNFPRLKIAAVHSPHKSLEVTLQFIGRFARTNVPDIGEAKFIAVLSEIEIERKRLFDEGAVWQEIIPDLSYGRIAGEIHVRKVLEEFRDPLAIDPRLKDLSLYSLYPRSHVKIYDISDRVDLRQLDISEWSDKEICYRNTNADGSVLIMVTRDLGFPKWSAGDEIVNVAYDLFVIYYDAETRLLFINSSRSVGGMYEDLADAIDPNAKALATRQVGRVVKEISNKRIFNVGMRNIQAANTRESYKIVTGPDAQIDPADARRYRQGHVFLTGEEDGGRTTIGYSSGGKVWSATNDQIPDLLDWCKVLGTKIRSAGKFVTHSGLDYLDAGRVADAIPDHLIYAQWNKDAFDFEAPVQVEYEKEDGSAYRGHILDLDLNLDRQNSDAHRIRVIISGDGLTLPVDFTLADFYVPVGRTRERVTVTKGNYYSNLIDYLNDAHLDFYTADGSLFSGNELFEPKEGALPIDANQLVEWNWDDAEIDNEIVAKRGMRSVHDKVKAQLENGDAGLIMYDHGTGEIADFITLKEDGDTTRFVFYHCKGSSEPRAGARVEDLFEVCGQAEKSVSWTSLDLFEKRYRRRRSGMRYLRGDAGLMQEVLQRAKDRRSHFEIKIVQPGISKAVLSPAMAEILGAANGHLVGVGIAPLGVITSP